MKHVRTVAAVVLSSAYGFALAQEKEAGKLAGYLNTWNDWVITPALLVVAVGVYVKYRKASALVLACGVGLVLIAQFLRLLYPAPLHAVSLILLACEIAGLAVGVASCVWFWRKDCRALRTEYNASIKRDRDGNIPGSIP